MNLQKLKEAIGQYKNFLIDTPEQSNLWKWESQRIFQENWDIEAMDFATMYDKSLSNSTTNRLWRRENYEPKAVMLKFIDMGREFVRDVFKDLFNESREVDGRLDRFVFHCDEMLREYQELHPGTKENSHFHDDNCEIASHYLAFRFPEIYTPYNFDAFKSLMEVLGSQDVPKVNDTVRFFKVMRTINGFLNKDEKLMSLHYQRLESKLFYQKDSLLMVEDFYLVISGKLRRI